MATNTEPSTPLLRFGDIKAWLPTVTKWQLGQLRAAGKIHPVQIRQGDKCSGRGSRIYYRKSELKEALGI